MKDNCLSACVIRPLQSLFSREMIYYYCTGLTSFLHTSGRPLQLLFPHEVAMRWDDLLLLPRSMQTSSVGRTPKNILGTRETLLSDIPPIISIIPSQQNEATRVKIELKSRRFSFKLASRFFCNEGLSILCFKSQSQHVTIPTYIPMYAYFLLAFSSQYWAIASLKRTSRFLQIPSCPFYRNQEWPSLNTSSLL